MVRPDALRMSPNMSRNALECATEAFVSDVHDDKQQRASVSQECRGVGLGFATGVHGVQLRHHRIDSTTTPHPQPAAAAAAASHSHREEGPLVRPCATVIPAASPLHVKKLKVCSLFESLSPLEQQKQFEHSLGVLEVASIILKSRWFESIPRRKFCW